MNEVVDYLDKILISLNKLNVQIENIEYRLIMVEEQLKDENENLEAIKHNIMK